MNKMRTEIGSEFEYSEDYLYEPELPIIYSGILTYSGRASISMTIRELLTKQCIKNVWFPSYCCESMIKPVLETGLNVKFYNVEFDYEKHLTRESFEPEEYDVVFTMGYFGFNDVGNEELIILCKEKNIRVIEDCTHSLLSQRNNYCKYRIASLRKWFPIASGGVATLESRTATLREPDSEIIEKRKVAMKEKRAYLSGNIAENQKDDFMNKYRVCNESFAYNYDCSIDSWSYSILMRQKIDPIRQRRRNNAKILLDGLKNILEVEALFLDMDESDCPLFVPIITSERDKLQKYLANRGIYCPAHWPQPCSDAKSNLYDKELSLICDQRYGAIEMERIVSTIGAFFKEK